jgi:hypothetical protein
VLIGKKWWHGALYTTTPSIFASSTNPKNYLKPTSYLTEMLRIFVLSLCVQSLNAVSPTSKPTYNTDDDDSMLMPSAMESTDTPTLVMFDGPTVYTTSDSMEPTSPPTFYVTLGDPTAQPSTDGRFFPSAKESTDTPTFVVNIFPFSFPITATTAPTSRPTKTGYSQFFPQYSLYPTSGPNADPTQSPSTTGTKPLLVPTLPFPIAATTEPTSGPNADLTQSPSTTGTMWEYQLIP